MVVFLISQLGSLSRKHILRRSGNRSEKYLLWQTHQLVIYLNRTQQKLLNVLCYKILPLMLNNRKNKKKNIYIRITSFLQLSLESSFRPIEVPQEGYRKIQVAANQRDCFYVHIKYSIIKS